MHMYKDSIIISFINILIFTAVIVTAQHLTLDSVEWSNYKDLYGKNYTNRAVEIFALYNYNYNSKLITLHNQLYARGLRTYGLKENQFTDMSLMRFNALFPVTTPLNETESISVTALPLQDSFNPSVAYGLTITSQDQGVHCSSGWAYAVAKAVELRRAYQDPQAHQILSAQNLIDCAGQGRGCRGQVAHTAFDYLVKYEQTLHLETNYPNRPEWAQQGMCLLPTGATTSVTVSSYMEIPDGNDLMLRQYLRLYPAVVEFNPTSFEFMHYAEGIFQQPRTSRGSHFMTVIGYDSGSVNVGNNQQQMDYWIVLNSFGNNWGEEGFIRIARKASEPLAKYTIIPTTVV